MTTEELLTLKVKEVMSVDVIAVHLDDTMKKVREVMDASNFHHIPVIDKNGSLKGIISNLDIAILMDWGSKLKLRTALKNNETIFSSQLAGDRMQKDIITISPEDSLETCAQIFKENIFRCLPVISDKKLVGMISIFDLLKAAYTRKKSVSSLP